MRAFGASESVAPSARVRRTRSPPGTSALTTLAEVEDVPSVGPVPQARRRDPTRRADEDATRSFIKDPSKAVKCRGVVSARAAFRHHVIAPKTTEIAPPPVAD
jgi:hypothetical protein